MKRFLLPLVLVLSGCAAQQPIDQATMAAAHAPLMCQGAEQCSLYWRRAQVWIAGNSRWKIQNATDSVITTYSPAQGDVSYGYQVLRIPAANGSENIRIYPTCGNMFGCRPQPELIAVAFKNFVRGGD